MASGAELIATALGGALGGGVLTLIGQELLAFCRRPKILIEYGDAPEYCTPSPIAWPWDNPDRRPVELESIFVRSKIKNSGRSVAKSCRAYMTHVARTNKDGTRFEIKGQDSMQIPWSLRDGEVDAIDLPPGINQFVDICFTISRDLPHKLFPAARLFPKRLRESWNQPGRFNITVMVTGEGFDPISKVICFEWDGPWDQIRPIV